MRRKAKISSCTRVGMLRALNHGRPAQASTPRGASAPRGSYTVLLNPVLTKGWLSEIGHSGRVCWLSGQPLSVGMDNGLRPGRTRDPDKSRHYEAALSSIKSDDVATQGAQANDNRPRRRTSDPEFRADQGTCGTVGPTARANRLTLVFQACRGGSSLTRPRLHSYWARGIDADLGILARPHDVRIRQPSAEARPRDPRLWYRATSAALVRGLGTASVSHLAPRPIGGAVLQRHRRMSRAFAMSQSVSPARIRAHAALNCRLQSSRLVPCPLSPLSDG
jgi:hypothetical protein